MLSMRLNITQKMRLILSQEQFVTIGDTPLFSLHRVNTILRKNPPKIGDELTRLFVRFLFKYNKRFQEKTGKKWSCVTLDGFRFSVTDTDSELQKTIIENSNGLNLSIEELENMKKIQIDKIILWFEVNYDDLIYNTNSKLPWVFIQYLKGRLTAWRNGMEFAFDQTIVEVNEQLGTSINE